jgi:hypothetical protein
MGALSWNLPTAAYGLAIGRILSAAQKNSPAAGARPAKPSQRMSAYQPSTPLSARRSDTGNGTLPNHICQIDTTHMKAKHMPITAPAPMVTHANG